jgi:hypothetical protein
MSLNKLIPFEHDKTWYFHRGNTQVGSEEGKPIGSGMICGYAEKNEVALGLHCVRSTFQYEY